MWDPKRSVKEKIIVDEKTSRLQKVHTTIKKQYITYLAWA